MRPSWVDFTYDIEVTGWTVEHGHPSCQYVKIYTVTEGCLETMSDEDIQDMIRHMFVRGLPLGGTVIAQDSIAMYWIDRRFPYPGNREPFLMADINQLSAIGFDAIGAMTERIDGLTARKPRFLECEVMAYAERHDGVQDSWIVTLTYDAEDPT